jgi:hypothetical protein
MSSPGVPVSKAGNLGLIYALITWWGPFTETGSIKSGEVDTEDTAMSVLGVPVGKAVNLGLITWLEPFTETNGKVKGSVKSG